MSGGPDRKIKKKFWVKLVAEFLEEGWGLQLKSQLYWVVALVVGTTVAAAFFTSFLLAQLLLIRLGNGEPSGLGGRTGSGRKARLFCPSQFFPCYNKTI